MIANAKCCSSVLWPMSNSFFTFSNRIKSASFLPPPSPTLIKSRNKLSTRDFFLSDNGSVAVVVDFLIFDFSRSLASAFGLLFSVSSTTAVSPPSCSPSPAGGGGGGACCDPSALTPPAFSPTTVLSSCSSCMLLLSRCCGCGCCCCCCCCIKLSSCSHTLMMSINGSASSRRLITLVADDEDVHSPQLLRVLNKRQKCGQCVTTYS
mmetsp:Transcript_23486/g.37610  ORF Transcript_23486/g.37610 Transcript_23486/m.37610 type:complete len:207 (-) Transcript_23486:944-1564(-)